MTPAPHLQLDLVDRFGSRVGLRLQPGMNVAIIGVDGAGKSTLVASLAKSLDEAGIPNETFHSFRKFENAFIVPFRCARNSFQRKAVHIYDRSIFDNISKWIQASRRRKTPIIDAFLQLLLKIVNLFYYHFSYIIHLTAPIPAILDRRPEITPTEAGIAQEVYAQLDCILKIAPLDTVTVEVIDR